MCFECVILLKLHFPLQVCYQMCLNIVFLPSFLYFQTFVLLKFSLCFPSASTQSHRFAGKTVTSGSLVLVTVLTKEEGAAQLTVNCEKMVIGTMLVKDILQALTQ